MPVPCLRGGGGRGADPCCCSRFILPTLAASEPSWGCESGGGNLLGVVLLLLLLLLLPDARLLAMLLGRATFSYGELDKLPVKEPRDDERDTDIQSSSSL